MTQNERWQKNYEGVKTFIESNHRNLSKYDLTERRLYTWLKHNKMGFVSPARRYELTSGCTSAVSSKLLWGKISDY